MRLLSLSALVPGLVFSCCTGLLCQSPDLSVGQIPTIQANARAVVLDVVVTRNDGRPLDGLGKADFEVFEDGKPEAIDFFEVHPAAGLQPVAQPAPPRGVYTNRPSVPQSDSVTILLFDRLNTAPQDQDRFLKAIDGLLKTTPAGARIAVFTLGAKLQLVRGFGADLPLTNAGTKKDGSQLSPSTSSILRTAADEQDDRFQIAALKEQAQMPDLEYTAGPELARLKVNERTARTLEALQQLARNLAGIGGRKNLIWFASSFPVSFFPDGQVQQSQNSGKDGGKAVRETAALLAASRVAVYPVAVQGIAGSGWTEAGDKTEAFGVQREIGQEVETERASDAANIAAMRQLAASTGGEAFYTTNDLAQATARALQSGSNYYTLAYTPGMGKPDGKFRRIQVRLRQGKASLAYRQGYFADTPGIQSAPQSADPLLSLLKRGMPGATQITYQVRLQPEQQQPAPGAARAGGNQSLSGPSVRYRLDFVVPVDSIRFLPGDNGAHTTRIETAAVVYDRNGKALNWTGSSFALNLSESSYAAAGHTGIPLHIVLDLPAADVYLSTGVYDLEGGTAGTLEIPLHPGQQIAPATTKDGDR